MTLFAEKRNSIDIAGICLRNLCLKISYFGVRNKKWVRKWVRILTGFSNAPFTERIPLTTNSIACLYFKTLAGEQSERFALKLVFEYLLRLAFIVEIIEIQLQP